MGLTVKERLEREKLAQEIRKLAADADLAELKFDQERRTDEEAAASEYEHRIYYFNEDVSQATVAECIATVGSWARRDPGPLTLVLNSPGGSVYAGLALYDFLRFISSQGNPVTTLALGRTASMGGILMQAGDTRIIGQHAYFHIHEVSSGTWGKANEMSDDLDQVKRLWEHSARLLAARSTMSVKQIKTRAERKEWWLDATEALAHGFVDAIQ